MVTGLVGFEDMTAEQKQIASEIHEKARQMERIKNIGMGHARIAMIEELTKEPTSIDYMIEKMERLFGCKIKEVV
jgi:hypothetical protein